jgi:hypothetical protein
MPGTSTLKHPIVATAGQGCGQNPAFPAFSRLPVDHNAASGLMEPENPFRLLKQYGIEATLMRTQSAANKLLDHIDGWQKVYADDIATIHVRKAGAAHTIEPAVDAKPR